MRLHSFALLLLACTVTSAQAAVYHYTLAGNFASPVISPEVIAPNDPYVLTFDLDTAIADTDPAAHGVFVGAITNLNFKLGPGAAGNYAGGTIAAGNLSVFDDAANDSILFPGTAAAGATGIAFANAQATNPVPAFYTFQGFSFAFNPKLDLFDFDGTTGDTLDSLLPGFDLTALPHAGTADARVTVTFNQNRFGATGSVTSITRTSDSPGTPAVPETSTNSGMLLAATLAASFLFRRHATRRRAS